jgi:hypothetical protein
MNTAIDSSFLGFAYQSLRRLTIEFGPPPGPSNEAKAPDFCCAHETGLDDVDHDAPRAKTIRV